MLVFHPVTWNLLLVAVPDIAQAMQVPRRHMDVRNEPKQHEQRNRDLCIAAAVYERKSHLIKKES